MVYYLRIGCVFLFPNLNKMRYIRKEYIQLNLTIRILHKLTGSSKIIIYI